MRYRTLAAALVLAALPARSARAEDRALSVEQIVQLVEENHPNVLEVAARVRSGRDTEKSARGRLLPSFRVAEEYQHWDSPYKIPFGTSVFPVRDQNTNSFSVTGDQPLLGLLHLAHERAAESLRAEATEAELLAARAELKASVQVQVLHLFEAKALEEIADASQKELGEELTVTQARLNAGVVTTADLLRVEVAVANAKQQGILAHSQREIARANLLGAIGFPQNDTRTTFVEPSGLLTRSRVSPPTLDAAESQAEAARPELRQRELETRAAEHTAQARLFSLLPEVDLEATYFRTDGSIFNPANAAFVGVKASWTVFEWGASYYAQRAAEHQAEAARQRTDSEKRQVAVEVSTDLAQVRAAAAAVDVADKTIHSAEEAYRVMQALLKAGTATTTDLLDSEAALTQARLNLTRAQYEQAIAFVALERSLGAR